LAELPDKPCPTRGLRIHGYHEKAGQFGSLSVYGSDAPALQRLQNERPGWGERLHPALPYTAAEVVWAARQEMARTVEDVLTRRTRSLFLNARAALAMAPRVAALLAEELGQNAAWQARQVEQFAKVAAGYLVT